MKTMKTVFDWDHFYTYLSGPIDFAPDRGISWRDEWVEKLAEIGFVKSHILNPCKKPLKGSPFRLDDEATLMKEYRDKADYKKLCEIVSHIAHIDLRLVDKSDIVLVYFPKLTAPNVVNMWTDSWHKSFGSKPVQSDPVLLNAHHLMDDAFKQLLSFSKNIHVPTYGTIHEIVVARQQRKPVFIVWEGGRETCSGWLMWLVGHQNVFGSFDDLLEHLKNISSGKVAYNVKEWLLLDLDKR